jgi:hypothetical protein
MARPMVPHVGAFTTENKKLIETWLAHAEPATKTQTSPGTAGDQAFDSNYLYVCITSTDPTTGQGAWTRIALAW